MDYQTLFEAIVDAVIVIDERGVIQDVNSGCCRAFGYSREELTGKNVGVLMPSSVAALHDGFIAAYLATNTPKIIGTGREVVAQHKNGETFPARLTVAEAKFQDRPQFVGIIQDLSKQAEAEAQANQALLKLQQINRSLTVAELGSALAHELNQPLTALALYLKAAQKQLSDRDEDQRLSEVFDKAADEGRRAADIIKRIRTMIEDRPIEIQALQLRPQLEETARFMRSVLRHRQVEIEVMPSDDDLRVLVDPVQLGQVFTNLIKNASEAAAPVASPTRIRLSYGLEGPDEDCATIWVEDNGPGFKDMDMDDLFMAFHTSKDEGLGIGLSLSKRMMQSQGGDMFADNSSALGGARLTVRVPIDQSGEV